MALDGAFLSYIRHEIEEAAIGAKVDKVYQPFREGIVLSLRWVGGSGKLLLNAGANSPRIHFTKAEFENPKTPPMFCMLVRKLLSGARLVSVRQHHMDRVLFLDFKTANEFGDPVIVTVAMEIMARHSNLIFISQDGKIIDSIKRVGSEMSSVRQVLPGMEYILPPPQDKHSLAESTPEEIFNLVLEKKDGTLSKILMQVVEGISPVVAREIAFYAGRDVGVRIEQMTEEQNARLLFVLGQIRDSLVDYTGEPTIVFAENNKPLDFSFLPIRQYGYQLKTERFSSCGELLDHFYAQRDTMERMKQRSQDLLRFLVNATERIGRKLSVQREELLKCGQREELKLCAELIHANLYRVKKGDEVLSAENYYDNNKPVEVKLDPRLTPSQNAQKYYADYRKAVTAEKMLTDLIRQGTQELEYLDSVFDLLSRATRESELDQIREELSSLGYLKNSRAKNKKPLKLAPLRYLSSDGFTILAGRNNLQNDRLTLREAGSQDIWLHTQKIPGSHTIILAQGQDVPNRTLEEAAVIAAYNSKARDSATVPVDYTQVRNVKKPGGAKPGMVIYDRYQTAYVTPDESLVQSLKEKEKD